MNIAESADRNVEQFGTYDAVIENGRVWTNSRIHELTCRAAAGLIERGIRPGDRVLLLLRNCVELVVAFTAALRAGAVAVPVFHRLPPADIHRIVGHVSPAAVFAHKDLAARAADALAKVVCKVLVDPNADSAASWLAFSRLEEYVPLAAPVARDARDPAQLTYTGGTSGTPKAVVYTHGGIAARNEALCLEGDADPSVIVVALPLGSVGAGTLTGRLAARWTLVLLDGFEPQRFAACVQEQRATHLLLVPSMAEALLSSPGLDTRTFSSVQKVTLTGAPASSRLLERFATVFSLVPTVGYGMTEAGGRVASSPSPSKPGSVGRAMPGTVLRIVDERERECPAGSPGEVQVRSPWLCDGYYGDPVATARLFQDGWLRTGDVGFLDDDSELLLIGRIKDVIIQGGVKVHPREVTDVGQLQPGVLECAAVGLPHPVLGEEVVACVVPQPGMSLTEEQVLSHYAAHLDPRKAPVRVVFVDRLPKTAAGKLDASDLRQLVRVRRRGSPSLFCSALKSTPSASRPRMLMEWLESRVRQLQESDVSFSGSAAFGDLGLNSLKLSQLAGVVSAALGHHIAPVTLFSHPTPEAFCRYLLTHLFDRRRAKRPRRPRRQHGSSPASRGAAVIGLGCRLPGGADNPARYWSLLCGAVDASDEIRRWNMDPLFNADRGTPEKTYTRRAALLEGAAAFDAGFFGLSASEAAEIDPQHRLLLEVAWEAIENAGHDARTWSGQRVGLFLGISGPAYARPGIGTAPSMAAGRLAHFFNFHGPAAVVDTSCSSSLYAVHQAMRSLRAGECDIALAGGVHVIGSPHSFVSLAAMNLLAADGRCKAFDASADGFGRGEGCAILVLKRLDAALAERDAIGAVLRGSAVCHDGRSASLTAPNGAAQEAVIRAALADADVPAADVDVLEAHGTGTPVGDPIELSAAMRVYGDGARQRPLVVGSVKTNIGHLEAAAGAAALMKVCLALQHAVIPAHLHYRTLNPSLAGLAAHFEIPSTSREWPANSARPRRAGVTSMGLSGTNVHVLAEEAPPTNPSLVTEAGRPQLLCLSARTAEALEQQAAQYGEHLAARHDQSFSDICYTAAVGRSHFSHRLAIVANDAFEAHDLLVGRASSADSRLLRGCADAHPKVAFLFTGHGSAYTGMAQELYDSQRTFRTAVRQCADCLEPALRRRLLAVMVDGGAAAGQPIDDVELAQPALFIIQWALSQLWRSWSVAPDHVLGHSLGEYAAACVAGLFSYQTGVRMAARRGRLLATLPSGGAMAAVDADQSAVASAIAKYGDAVCVAAVNGPASTVISGSDSAVGEVLARMQEAHVHAKRLPVAHAMHSPLMEPIMGGLERAFTRVRFRPLQTGFVSSVTGAPASDEELAKPQYWSRHLRVPVQFRSAIGALRALGCNVFLELGPHAVLTQLGQDCVPAVSPPCWWVPSLRRGRGHWDQLVETLGELYVAGVRIDWRGLYGTVSCRRVNLPTYPFQRQRYWISDTATGVDSAMQQRDADEAAPGLESRLPARPLTIGESKTREPLNELVHRFVREVSAQRLGQPTDWLTATQNLFEAGLDSMGVVDIVSAVRRRFAIRCAPSDLTSRPTVESFATFISERATSKHAGAPVNAHISERVSSTPIVVLNDRGIRPPLFCFHPSGGQISAYVQLAKLLPDDQPIYAVQSRALHDPTLEHRTIRTLAVDYATLVQDTRPEGRYRLCGWSMGAIIAHAVAAELERRGARVETVGMIDPPAIGHRLAHDRRASDLALAITAIMHDVRPDTPDSLCAASVLEALCPGAPAGEVLRTCEARGLVPAGVLAVDTFDAAVRLYRRHFHMLRVHRATPVSAPLLQWWSAGLQRESTNWAAVSSGVTERVLEGTHFSIVRRPLLDCIAEDLSRLH